MLIDLVNLTEKDIQESCERMMSDSSVITDMLDYYSYKLYQLHQKLNIQKEETISEIPMSEISNSPKTLKLTRDICRQADK